MQIAEAKQRQDGRTALQIRQLEIVRGLLNRADGSAKWSNGHSSVLAAVYGPHGVGSRREDAEKASIEVLWKPKSGQAGSGEREGELILQRTAEAVVLAGMHPRTGITIVVQVVHDDGALLACALNCVCAALVDAGIPMKRLFAAVSCGVSKEGEVILDPTKAEDMECMASVSLSFLCRPRSTAADAIADAINGQEPEDDGVLTSVTVGPMAVGEYLTCLQRGRAACGKVADFARVSLERYQRGSEFAAAE